jgi:hypothetical protein
MLRPLPSLLALLAAATFVSPAVAADYWSGDDFGDTGGFRDGYPTEPGQWSGLGDADDPLHLEAGVRYWYSMGAQSVSDLAGTFTTTDTSHITEGFLRVEDHSTNTWASVLAGYAVAIGGTYTDPYSAGVVPDGYIGYIGTDLGWNAWSDGNGSGVGPLVGYMYWNNSPRTSRFGYTTATSATDVGYDQNTGETFLPMDSVDNNIDIHMLRLGVQGKGVLGPVDISFSAAAVPYAKVDGVIGSDETSTAYDFSVFPGGNVASIKASPTALNGWGYGGQAELFVGFHPTDNLAIRLGGRAWYLQGTADVTFDQATVGNPSDSDALNPPNFDLPPSFGKQTYIETAQPFSTWRYGLLAEATYSF